MSTDERVDWNQLICTEDESDDSGTCTTDDYVISSVPTTRCAAAEMSGEKKKRGIRGERETTTPVISLDVSEEEEEDLLDIDCDDSDITGPPDICEIHEHDDDDDDEGECSERSDSSTCRPPVIDDDDDDHRRSWKIQTAVHTDVRRPTRRVVTKGRVACIESDRCTDEVHTYKRPTQGVRKERRRVRSHTASNTATTMVPRRNRSRRHIVHGISDFNHGPTQGDVPGSFGDYRWTLRTMRNGYEGLVYEICNCNETPNVVFAGLCYLRHDVYTMVLRNCDGKRRYWYDKSVRRKQVAEGVRIGDFERAMRWRANTVGRASNSPGYDLAAFVLQNVTTDKRYDSSMNKPLVVVTTDDMLTDPPMYGQLVYTAKRANSNTRAPYTRLTVPFQPAQTQRRVAEHCCYVCHAPAGIVTRDNASVPTLTCWQHAAPYLATASADRTHLCNTAIVDLQFLRGGEASPDAELVCRLRLITTATGHGGDTYGGGNRNMAGDDDDDDDGDGALTIAEFTLLPGDALPSQSDASTLKRIDLETAHSATCPDQHYNDEDLFPSMPVTRPPGNTGIGRNNNNSSGVRHYDTTVGRVVDRIHCIASKFQK